MSNVRHLNSTEVVYTTIIVTSSLRPLFNENIQSSSIFSVEIIIDLRSSLAGYQTRLFAIYIDKLANKSRCHSDLFRSSVAHWRIIWKR